MSDEESSESELTEKSGDGTPVTAGGRSCNSSDDVVEVISGTAPPQKKVGNTATVAAIGCW